MKIKYLPIISVFGIMACSDNAVTTKELQQPPQFDIRYKYFGYFCSPYDSFYGEPEDTFFVHAKYSNSQLSVSAGKDSLCMYDSAHCILSMNSNIILTRNYSDGSEYRLTNLSKLHFDSSYEYGTATIDTLGSGLIYDRNRSKVQVSLHYGASGVLQNQESKWSYYVQSWSLVKSITDTTSGIIEYYENQ